MRLYYIPRYQFSQVDGDCVQASAASSLDASLGWERLARRIAAASDSACQPKEARNLTIRA